uniref:Glyco_trans_2-like domain-containing protein n=1 Tax=Heterorhabditis bacteriophora TaxID=37862 RepID=A0A1I7WPF7_HETBA
MGDKGKEMKLDQNLIYEDISVICIYDDGSTDTTSDYIRRFLPMFAAQGIHVLYKIGIVSRGVGFAKNRAAEMGRGRFLCFCDADDVSMPDRIQKQYDRANALESNGGLVFLGSGFRRDPIKSTERYTRWANGLFKDDLRIQVHTSHGPTLIAPTWFISRMLYTILGGFEEKYQSGFPEDLEFFIVPSIQKM